MKGIALISLILFLISVSGSSYSQNHKIDSLKKVFAQHPDDTVGLYALRKVARLYLDGNDYYNTIKTANQTIDLAKKLNNNFIIGEMYSAISDVYLKQDNYGENIRYSYMALKHYEYAGNIHRQADMFQVIGVARRYMGKFDEAAAAYKKAFELRSLINDKIGMAQSKNTLGQMLLSQNKVDSAQVLFFEALAFFEDAGDSAPWGLPLTYNSIGVSYDVVGDSLAPLGKKALADSNYLVAYKYYELALGGWAKMGNTIAEVEARLNMGNILMKLGKYAEARKYLVNGIQSALKNKTTKHLRFGYLIMSDLEGNCGNYKAAFEYYQLYIEYRDKIQNDASNQKDLQSRMQYEFDKKEAANKADQDKKEALAKTEIEEQKSTVRFTMAGVFLLLCFATYVFYNYQRKRKYEKQQALSTERLRISRELHDDIGSTLGSIAVYSDVAKRRSAKDDVSEEALGKIGKASRELIEKMGDIIWNLNPENENFEQLLNRMQAFAAMTLASQNINVDFNFDESLKALALSPEHRKNLFLIFKESIHNIIKHAEANNVFITLRKENDVLNIRIKDDGKGFEINNVQSVNLNNMGGNGLKSMTNRAKAMLASFNIGSKVNEGTTIDLSITI